MYLNFIPLISSENHEWLLSDKVDILSSLLFPLAGPETFDDDDMEKLPADLQYLDDDKTREPEAEIRKMLVEALFQVRGIQGSLGGDRVLSTTYRRHRCP
jgi:hypothetical protein